MRPEPLPGLIPPLISEADCDPVILKSPEFLDEPIFLFAGPFPRQERHNFFSTADEFRAIAPLTIGSVGLRYLFRILTIPGIFRKTNLLNSSFGIKGRKGGAGHWKFRLWFGDGSLADPVSVSIFRNSI